MHNLVKPATALFVPFPSITAHSVETHNASPIEEVLRPCQGTAFSRGEVLCRVEAECYWIRSRSDRFPLVGRRHRMRRIFDDRDTVGFSDCPNGVEIDRMSGVMDRDDRLRT